MSNSSSHAPETAASSPQPADVADTALSHVLSRLADVIRTRRDASPESSYVARLFHKGTDTMLKKVGEESAEVLLAAKHYDLSPSEPHRQALISELADLWFHNLVVMEHLHVRPEEILSELMRREGLSGLEEYARRGTAPGPTLSSD